MSELSLEKTDVLILVGGQGKRLRQVVDDRPKPMADVGGRPFLDLLIDYASGFGVQRFILCAGYKAGFIEAYYQNAGRLQQIIVSHEEQPLGTAGAIKRAENHLQSDPFLVMNGDSFCNVDLNEFLEFHLHTGAWLSAVLVPAKETQDMGTVELNAFRQVVRFEEKKESDKQALANAGIYLFDRRALPLIPAGIRFSLEYDLFPKLAAGGRFYGYVVNAELIDIGTPERYRKAQQVLPRNPHKYRGLAETESNLRPHHRQP